MTPETVEQSRRPAGFTDGGQFTARARTAPDGTLDEVVDGTFSFPPGQFESFESFIDFWENVHISDRVLSNAEHAYRRWRQEQINARVVAAYAAYGNEREVVKLAKKDPHASDIAAQEYFDEIRAAAEADYPMREIPEVRMRAVLRAHQIASWQGTIPAAEKHRAMTHELHVSGSVGRQAVAVIVEEYRTVEWADRSLTDTDLAAVDAMRDVAAALRGDG